MKKIGKSVTVSSTTPIHQLLSRFYPWCLLLAILILVWLLAQAFWLMLAPPKAANLSPVAMQTPTAPTDNYANALDFFAQASAVQATVVPPPDVKVLGVTIASPERFSFAILSANGKTQSYRLNDLLEGSNYKLAAIKRDAITLADATGQTVKIPFGQPFKLDQSDAIRAGQTGTTNVGLSPSLNNGAATLSQNIAPSAALADPDNPAANQAAQAAINSDMQNPNATNSQINNNQPSSNKAALGGAVEGMQQNPNAYLSHMGVAATGQGYLVTNGMPAGLRRRLGLQTGDTVLSVNGKSVGQNPAQDAQVLQQIQQSGQAQIQVRRGEQVITVNQSL